MRAADPNGPSAPLFGVIEVTTAAKIVTALGQWQRRRRADGLPTDAAVDAFTRALVGAYGGPAGTPLGPAADAPDAEAMTTATRLLTYEETATRLALSERQVKRLVNTRALPAVHIGAAARVHSDDLDDFMNSLRNGDQG